MNNRSAPSTKKSEIPVMSKDQLISHWSQKAEQLGGIQMFRPDGNPLIGGIIDTTVSTTPGKMPRSKKGNQCKLDCCSEKRPLISTLPGFAPRISQFPDYSTLEPEFTGWQKVEPRSVRRLKTRARFQKDEVKNYTRPSVLYAMDD